MVQGTELGLAAMQTTLSFSLASSGAALWQEEKENRKVPNTAEATCLTRLV